MAMPTVLRFGGNRRNGDRKPADRPPQNKIFFILLAAPGIIWLALLFIVPFYDVLAIAGGRLNFLTESPVPVYNPLNWSHATLVTTWHDIFGVGAFALPIIWRTIWYTAVAAALCVLIGYPAAYFVARFAGRRKALFLVLLIAPFWISYMMRMLAWIDLLQTNGYVNKVLTSLHIVGQPVNWLGGHSFTVILGLVYGYIPYMILVLYAGLDRIDPSLIEAGRDLGLSRIRTFLRVTLPLSRQPILTAMLITVLPMVGDYFTNQLLSGAPNTSMIGNLIQGQLGTPGLEGQGAILSLLVLIVLLIWAPVNAARDPVMILIIGVLGLIGIEALRRIVQREFPDVTERELGHRLHGAWTRAYASVRHGSEPAPAPHPEAGRYAALEQLATLHDRGALSDQEYAAEKSALLVPH